MSLRPLHCSEMRKERHNALPEALLIEALFNVFLLLPHLAIFLVSNLKLMRNFWPNLIDL